MSTVQERDTLAPPATGALSGFPIEPYTGIAPYFQAYMEEMQRATRSITAAALNRAAAILIDTYTQNHAVFSCGNGGSAAIANHMQCDHLKGIRTTTDIAPRVVSLSTNIELLTAIANDIGYEDIFAYQLQSQSTEGDALIAISSSGRSANIVRALAWARDHGLRTIALTGFDGGDARLLADVSIHVDGANYGIIEDIHEAIMHALAQYIRQSRMTAASISASVF